MAAVVYTRAVRIHDLIYISNCHGGCRFNRDGRNYIGDTAEALRSLDSLSCYARAPPCSAPFFLCWPCILLCACIKREKCSGEPQSKSGTPPVPELHFLVV